MGPLYKKAWRKLDENEQKSSKYKKLAYVLKIK